MKTTSQDSSLEKALAFIMENEQSRLEWISPTDESEKANLELSWIPETWWLLVTGRSKRDPLPLRVNRPPGGLRVHTAHVGPSSRVMGP
jgi:hypothetical protein